jgi:hypothetical protein
LAFTDPWRLNKSTWLLATSSYCGIRRIPDREENHFLTHIKETRKDTLLFLFLYLYLSLSLSLSPFLDKTHLLADEA